MTWQLPAIVVALLTWFLTPPAGLADLARREAFRRQITPRSVRSLSDADAVNLAPRPLPAPAATVASGAPIATDAVRAEKSDEELTAAGSHDEAWWRGRMSDARAAFERDELLADALQTRVNVLTVDAEARDDPAQRGILRNQRARALTELNAMKEQIGRDRMAIEKITEDARKHEVPPGWIR